MMPENVLSDPAMQSRFLYPDDLPADDLEDFEMGGIDLQDPSKGLQVQMWYGHFNPSTSFAYVRKGSTGVDVPLFVESQVLEFKFTFDQNMRWAAVTRHVGNIIRFRWYDTAIAAYTVTEYYDVTAVHLTLDDKRRSATLNDSNDIILTYLKSNRKLYTRQQRERYTVERELATLQLDDLRISNFGMARNLRLQWRLTPRIHKPGTL